MLSCPGCSGNISQIIISKIPTGGSTILLENHWFSLIMVWKGHWRAKHTNHVVKGTERYSRETGQKDPGAWAAQRVRTLPVRAAYTATITRE